MGGYSASDFIMAYPDDAAATVLICGASELTPETALKLANLPIRIYHSDDDDVVPVEVSRNFYNKLLTAGGDKAEYYEISGFGHYAWNYAYKSDMVEWMFDQRRSLSSEPVQTSEPTPDTNLPEGDTSPTTDLPVSSPQDSGGTIRIALIIAIVSLVVLSAAGTVLILIKRNAKKS